VTIPTLRAPRRDATENRAALIAAAKVVLNTNPDASLESIAAEAGLSRRAVYGHFASRDDLMRELVAIGAERVATALGSITHKNPLVRIALIASGLWHEVENIRVMAVFTVRGPLKHHTDEALRPLRQGVLGAIHAGQAEGGIRPDIEAPRLARLMEDAMFAVLEESTSYAIPIENGHRLIMLNVLATIGLGWRDASDFIDAHPELAWKAAS